MQSSQEQECMYFLCEGQIQRGGPHSRHVSRQPQKKNRKQGPARWRVLHSLSRQAAPTGGTAETKFFQVPGAKTSPLERPPRQ